MLTHTIFFLLVLFALLGDARIFLFIMNRVVFGSHRHEKSPWNFLLYTVPPLLLVLTLLFWPLHRWISWLMARAFVERVTPDSVEKLLWMIPLAKIGAAWLFIAAATGLYWIVDRIRLNLRGEIEPEEVRDAGSRVIRMRKAHVPIAVLRALGAHNDLYDLEVTRHEVSIEDLPASFDGYRIAFLTDTHVASFVRPDFYREIQRQVAAFDPDLVILGGDFVTWHRHIPLMADVLLTDLRARDGLLAVLGNHDYWAGGNDVRTAMEAKGVRFIINDSVAVRRGTDGLAVVGIDEVYRGEPDIEAAFRNAGDGPCIGVTHHPDMVDEIADRRIDLLLCGHTHGGQIRFPFFGAVVVPSVHEQLYAAGFRRVGRVLMYVSRGLGAIPPLRILCRPEVATFVLRAAVPSPREAGRGWPEAG